MKNLNLNGTNYKLNNFSQQLKAWEPSTWFRFQFGKQKTTQRSTINKPEIGSDLIIATYPHPFSQVYMMV